MDIGPAKTANVGGHDTLDNYLVVGWIRKKK